MYFFFSFKIIFDVKLLGSKVKILVYLYSFLTLWKISLKIRFKLNKVRLLKWSEYFDVNGKRKIFCDNERSNEFELRMIVYENFVFTYIVYGFYFFLGFV